MTVVITKNLMQSMPDLEKKNEKTESREEKMGKSKST